VRVEEHTTTVEGVPVFYRSAGDGSAGAAGAGSAGGGPLDAGSAGGGPLDAGLPGGGPLYLHDALTSSDDWVPFLERTGGLAPDLIGFGRSGKGGHLDYSPEGLTGFVKDLLSELGAEPTSVVGHGWGGALALLLAQQDPSRVKRLVLIDAVPLLDGFSWHGPARVWRRPLIGELVMGATPRWLLARELRKATVRPDAWTAPRLEEVWDQFDQGTQRALLRLHRAADERRLAELGRGLGTVTAPALVVWGENDPWFSPQFADAYGAALPDATVERIPDAGHWPWLDQPRVIDRVAEWA
jgi:pimeloyl-ACP methyl ester carboxylesterase